MEIIYITAANKREAKKIARELIKARLVACVNIIGGVTSVYRWKGRIEEGAEALLIAKTRKARVHAVIKKVKSIHSYSCPCVLSIPVRSVNRCFLQWIKEETG